MSATVHRLALLRRTDGLFELRGAVVEERPVLELVPLAGNGGDNALLEAWQSLAAVAEIRPGVLDAVRTVISATGIDPWGEEPAISPLRIEPPPPPHRPTAAHPRAYKGTKDRPPKRRRPEPQDLRPMLCAPGSQDRLIGAVVAALDVEPPPDPDEFRAAPPSFRRHLAWLLRGKREAAGLRASYWSLDLENRPDLLALLALTIARHGVASAVSWCAVLQFLQSDDRPDVLAAALGTGAGAIAIDSDRRSRLVLGFRHCRGDQAAERRRYLLSALVGGHDLDAVAAGFELADAYRPDASFEGQPAPRAAAEAVATIPGDRIEPCVATSLWSACATRPGLAEALREIPWQGLAPAAGRVLAALLAYGQPELRAWPAWRERLGASVEAVSELPWSHQEKAVHVLWETVVDTSDPDLLCRALVLCREAMKAICAEECPPRSHVGGAIARLAHMEAEGLGAFARLPVRAWRDLDEACRRRNDAHRIRRGLAVLCEMSPDLVRAAWTRHPRPLLRAARTLGLLAFPLAESLTEEVVDGPLWFDYRAAPAERLVAVFDGAGPRRGVQPVSHRLRRHFEGGPRLTPGQLARDAERIRDAWEAVVCDRIHERALEHMASSALGEPAGGHLEDGRLRHAVMLHADVHDSRRSLRRLLRACMTGAGGQGVDHPRNRQWARSHPRIDLATWTRGPALSRGLDDGRKIEIAIERDPLEVMRLGTHVGSCFGLGGSFDESAVAIALDVNKQVAFARDERGDFVARQIVAITDDDRLACFAVYPLRSGGDVKAAFRAWDLELARALGVELARESEDPDIELLVAESWWNDGVWKAPSATGENHGPGRDRTRGRGG